MCYLRSMSFPTLGRILAILFTIILITVLLIFCKTYIKVVLLWLESLEKKNSFLIVIIICILFIIVSLPISIGYIGLVLASGYLLGIIKGILIVIFGANTGLFVAHNIIKLIGHHPKIYKYTQNDMASAIIQVISGPLCFKIVLCSRLTPIPFGWQNTIFALSNVSAKVYHLASFLGLFPAQFVAVYIGSTLRSMQDVIGNNNISSTTYFFVILQLICGASLIVWIGSKARKELLKVLAEAENTSNKSYSLV